MDAQQRHVAGAFDQFGIAAEVVIVAGADLPEISVGDIGKEICASEVPWLVGRSITCNDSARIAHKRLPGGEMTGKVISVELTIPRRGGRRTAKITLAAVPGSGSIAPEPGPDQHQTGAIVYSTSYRQPQVPVNTFALPSQPPRVYSFENAAPQQLAAAMGSGDPVGAIGQMPTRLRIAFSPLREEDLLTRRMSVTCLPPALPKQINLRPDLGEM